MNLVQLTDIELLAIARSLDLYNDEHADNPIIQRVVADLRRKLDDARPID